MQRASTKKTNRSFKMKAVVAASRHWLDGEVIRDHLVQLPISSTVVVSNRPGGDSLVAKIAEEEMALHVERIEVCEEDFKRKMLEELNDEVDSALFFCCSESEVEYIFSRYARNHRISTEVIIKSFEVQ
jgi:hypothetical protein